MGRSAAQSVAVGEYSAVGDKCAGSTDMLVALSNCTVAHHAGSRSPCIYAFTLAALPRIIFLSVGRTLLFPRVALQMLGECQSLEFWGVVGGPMSRIM